MASSMIITASPDPAILLFMLMLGISLLRMQMMQMAVSGYPCIAKCIVSSCMPFKAHQMPVIVAIIS